MCTSARLWHFALWFAWSNLFKDDHQVTTLVCQMYCCKTNRHTCVTNRIKSGFPESKFHGRVQILVRFGRFGSLTWLVWLVRVSNSVSYVESARIFGNYAKCSNIKGCFVCSDVFSELWFRLAFRCPIWWAWSSRTTKSPNQTVPRLTNVRIFETKLYTFWSHDLQTPLPPPPRGASISKCTDRHTEANVFFASGVA